VQGASQLLFFALIAAVFWFLLIRPQRRRQQELAATQRTVELGDEVMLGAGIFGVVTRAEDEFLELETSPGARMKVARAAVVRVVVPEDGLDEDGLDEADSPDTTPGH
jgi:preprotein translocase subunit YajC